LGKSKVVWACRECGQKAPKWLGNCPACREWNSFEEELQLPEKEGRFDRIAKAPAQPVRVQEVSSEALPRIATQMNEVDRLLGGGIVPGSLTLVGGEPGIGKSTLMLQLCHALAKQGLLVLYVCGEESTEQTAMRARRLGAVSEQLFLLSETIFSHVKLHIDKLKPDILIIDSVQILYKSEIQSAPGSVTQVREIASECMHLSKGLGISTFLIGHVTKGGEIAGPKMLEHLVDTVLEFEGDRQHGYRTLRAIKNRFGSTDDVAIFQMGITGLTEVSNPSLLFLQERSHAVTGSVIIPTVEGSRAILIELQALVAPSSFQTASRRSTGLDQNRLALLLAVLEKRMGYHLHQCDVFVSIAGGLKIIEPAIDLGILLAIASSFCNKAIDSQTIVLGEVGLGGEVRSVPRIEMRLKEAIHMGFQSAIIPKRNLKGLPQELTQKIALRGVELVEEAIRALIN